MGFETCTAVFMEVKNSEYDQVSMIRKYQNHKLQTNPWHHEEEPHNHETPGKQFRAVWCNEVNLVLLG